MTKESDPNYLTYLRLEAAITAVKDFFKVPEVKLDNTTHRVMVLTLFKRAKEENYQDTGDMANRLWHLLANARKVFEDILSRKPELKAFEDRLVFLSIVNQIKE